MSSLLLLGDEGHQAVSEVRKVVMMAEAMTKKLREAKKEKNEVPEWF